MGNCHCDECFADRGFPPQEPDDSKSENQLLGMPANWPEESPPEQTDPDGLIPVYRIKDFDDHFYTDDPEDVIRFLHRFHYAEIIVIDMLLEVYRNIPATKKSYEAFK